ncbi:ABC transporter permease [Streptomyces sp. NPDC020707]|uniref:ABC transporter permease n=1 Tax=Streptomyces sp. NPDC020707 TaxID=3365084 RepID=UPI0037B7410D
MFRTALRNVLAHKARLLMTVLAVLLGVAFVSGTLVFTDTISKAYQKSSEKGFDDVDVAVRPHDKHDDKTPGDPPRLSRRLLDQISAVPGADTVTGTVAGYTAVADKDGDLLGNGFSSTGGNYYPAKNGKDPRYDLGSGRAPNTAAEVALDAKTADRGDYRVGDTVRLSTDGPVRQKKIVGIFSTDDGNVAAGGTLTLFDDATAEKLFTEPGQYDQIDVKAAAGTSQATLKAGVDKLLPARSEAVTGKKLADDQAKDIKAGMSGLQTGLLVFAGIALFVSIFIIANTFTMLVAQRTRELALMRAVGASRRQVTRSVLIEATVVGSVAAVTGLLAGIGLGAALRSLLGATGSTVPDGPLVVSSTTVLAALLVGVVVTVLAAWLPGRRAAKIPPIAAMSSVHAAPSGRGLVVRNTIGAILAGGGVALVLAATGMSSGDAKAPMGLGAGALVIGVFVLTPLLSRPMIAACAPVLRVFGVAGTLARQNAVRNPRRTAATASALMIGLTLITGLTVIAGSVQKSIDEMAAGSLRSDYVVSLGATGATGLSPNVEKILKRTDGVTATSTQRTSPALVDGDTATLTGVNGDTIGRMISVDFSSGSLSEVTGNNIVVDDDTAQDNNWHAGSKVPVTFEDGAKEQFTVAGVYEGNSLLNGVVIDSAVLSAHMADVTDSKVMVKTEDGPKQATKDALEKALGDNPAINVQDRKDISNGIAKAITLLLNMLYGLLAMAVIVAVLGVINTLAMSVFERSREIGMLRAIGLDRKGIKRMVRLESLVISLFGAVLGLCLGAFFGWAAGELIAPSLPTYELVMPWGRLGLFLALAAGVGMLAAVWPARRASKLNMLAAIKSE